MILSWPCVLCGADFRRCDGKAPSCCAPCRKSGRTDGTTRHARSGGGEFLFRDVARRGKPPHTIGRNSALALRRHQNIGRHPAVERPSPSQVQRPQATLWHQNDGWQEPHSRSPSCAATDVISAGINSKEQNTAVLPLLVRMLARRRGDRREPPIFLLSEISAAGRSMELRRPSSSQLPGRCTSESVASARAGPAAANGRYSNREDEGTNHRNDRRALGFCKA